MNVYVESNFVLELALLQEQHSACEEILSMCVARAPEHQTRHSLSALDAVVFASVLAHLEQAVPPRSCFLNRDAGFFGSEIAETLKARNCKFLRGFDQGLQFLRGKLEEESPS